MSVNRVRTQAFRALSETSALKDVMDCYTDELQPENSVQEELIFAIEEMQDTIKDFISYLDEKQ